MDIVEKRDITFLDQISGRGQWHTMPPQPKIDPDGKNPHFGPLRASFNI